MLIVFSGGLGRADGEVGKNGISVQIELGKSPRYQQTRKRITHYTKTQGTSVLTFLCGKKNSNRN